jgi:hypothetical protein
MHARLSCDLWSKCPYVELLEAASFVAALCIRHHLRLRWVAHIVWVIADVARGHDDIAISSFRSSLFPRIAIFTTNYNTFLTLELEHAANQRCSKTSRA